MRAVLALALTVASPGCGATVDLFGQMGMDADAGGSGEDAIVTSSGTDASGGLDDASTGAGDASGEGSTGLGTNTAGDASTSNGGSESSSGGRPIRGLCDRLDLLFVIDNTTPNDSPVAQLLAGVAAVGVVLTDPTRPWSDDFHVGVVSALDTDALATCRVSGGLAQQPDPLGAPCVTAGGEPWATQDDPDLVATLQCLAAVESTAEAARPLVQAAARGLGVPPAVDAGGAAVVAGCNDGFAREASLKLIVVVTADDDAGSPGDGSTWASWFSELHDAPLGSELAVAAILPEGPPVDPCPGPAAELASWLVDEPNTLTTDGCAFEGMTALDFIVEVDQLLAGLCPE